DRWIQDLINWIFSQVSRSQAKWWIVLDGFNDRELEQRKETRLLITKLAKAIQTGNGGRRFRLILIDFQRSSLPVPPGTVAVDDTAPIPQGAVRSCVHEILRLAPPTLDPQEITDKILEGLGDPVSDLPALSERLTHLIGLTESRA